MLTPDNSPLALSLLLLLLLLLLRSGQCNLIPKMGKALD